MKSLSLEEFTVTTRYGFEYIPIKEWSKAFKFSSLLPMLKQHVPTNEIIITTGEAFRVSWEAPHECDCEYCNDFTTKERWFIDKTEAIKLKNSMETDSKDYDEISDVTFQDGLFYLRATKQNKDMPKGLFNG